MSSSCSDQEMVTFFFIRTEYEKKFKNIIPMFIKYLIIKYSSRIIPFEHLMIKEDLKFINILENKLDFKIYKFVSIFKASQYSFSASKFHEICNKLNGNLVMMKSNFGCVFGGYTSKSWRLSGETDVHCIEDSKSFIFLIRYDDDNIQSQCPLILYPKNSQTGIVCMKDFGPIFGGFDIHVGSHCRKINWSRLFSYENETCVQLRNVCGGNVTMRICDAQLNQDPNLYLFIMQDFEVFELLY